MTKAKPQIDVPAASPQVIGFDTETHLIARGRLAPRLVCLSLSWLGDTPPFVEKALRGDAELRGVPGGGFAVLGASEAHDAFRAAMKGGHILVGHNVPYDLTVLGRAFPDLVRSIFATLTGNRVLDTQVQEQLIRIAKGTLRADGGKVRPSLASLVWNYLQEDIGESKTDPNAWRLRYSELDGVPVKDWPETAIAYAGLDAVYAQRVAEAQVERDLDVGGHPVVRDGKVVSAHREVAVAFALHLEATWGLRLDAPRTTETFARWTELARKGSDAAKRRGWLRPDGSADTKMIKQVVEEALGLDTPRTPPSKTYPEGQVKRDEETLLLAADASDDDDLRAYAESVEYIGHLNRYADVLVPAPWPLTSAPNVLIESGRTSWTQPNLQAPPREGGFRECFIPRDGWVFCAVDYETIELVALAQICIWLDLGTKMADAINDGADLHAIFGAELSGDDGHPTTPEKLKEAIANGDKRAKEYRQIAKHGNFAFVSGQGPRSFRRMVKKQAGISIDEARAIQVHEQWFRTWPQARAYFRWVDSVASDGVCRQFQSGRVRGGCRVTSAYNTYFQGLVADGAKYGTWLLAHAAYTGDLPGGVGPVEAARAFAGCRPVLFLHDENIAEIPTHRASEAGEAMAEIMRYAMTKHIPDVKVGAEPALMDRWCKDAKTVRDNQNRLKLWVPK